jgi:hypothetical protein
MCFFSFKSLNCHIVPYFIENSVRIRIFFGYGFGSITLTFITVLIAVMRNRRHIILVMPGRRLSFVTNSSILIYSYVPGCEAKREPRNVYFPEPEQKQNEGDLHNVLRELVSGLLKLLKQECLLVNQPVHRPLIRIVQ